MTVQEFLELNESSIGSSGAKWDSCESLIQINKARSALYGLHNWNGLLQSICINGCGRICLPWFADSIKSAYRCNKQIHIAAGEYFTFVNSDCCGQPEAIVDTGEYSPVPGSNTFCTKIGFRPTDFEDAGKEVKLTYINAAGSELTEVFKLSAEGFSVTEYPVSKFLSIKKDSTYGRLNFHKVDINDQLGDKVFVANPQESNLRYRIYCLNTVCCNGMQIVLKVKRKYIPFTEMHYNLPIDFSEHGLSLAMEAIAEKHKRTPEGLKMYQELMKSAINYFKVNTAKEESSFHDLTLSHDYPAIVEDECGCH